MGEDKIDASHNIVNVNMAAFDGRETAFRILHNMSHDYRDPKTRKVVALAISALETASYSPTTAKARLKEADRLLDEELERAGSRVEKNGHLSARRDHMAEAIGIAQVFGEICL